MSGGDRRDGWDCYLQNDWKGKAIMKCMEVGDGRSMDEMVYAGDGGACAAMHEVGSGPDVGFV
jgi:hypothetical protein